MKMFEEIIKTINSDVAAYNKRETK